MKKKYCPHAFFNIYFNFTLFLYRNVVTNYSETENYPLYAY